METNQVVTDISGVQTEPSPSAAKLSGNMGVLDIIFTVLAYNSPLTAIIAFIPIMISVGNGLGTPLIFLAAAGLLMLFAVGFTAMSRHVPNAGAYYAYISVGLGRPFGLGSAFMAILLYLFMLTGSYLYASIVLGGFSQDMMGINLGHWWEYTLALMAVVAVLGYYRITLSAKVLTLALAGEVIVVALWDLAVAWRVGPSNLTTDWLNTTTFFSGSIGLALLFGVTCFSGFEATAIFREEVKNPERTIPLATYGSIIFMGGLYAIAAYFLIIAIGPDEALTKTSEGYATLAMESVHDYLGRVGRDTVSVLMCTSIFAAVLSLQNILSRYLYCLGVDGILPRRLAEVHGKHGSPHRASLLTSLLSLIAIVGIAVANVVPAESYAVATGIAGYAMMMLQLLTSLAVVVYFKKKTHAEGCWKTSVAPILSMIGLSVTFWLGSTNLDLLTGNATVAYLLIGCVLATLIFGLSYAVYLRRYKPTVYAAIGRQSA